MSPALEGGGKEIVPMFQYKGRELGQEVEQEEVAEGHLSRNYTFVLSLASS